MNEAKLNVKIISTEKISVEGQIELVRVIKATLKDIVPDGARILVGREVSNEELIAALK